MPKRGGVLAPRSEGGLLHTADRHDACGATRRVRTATRPRLRIAQTATRPEPGRPRLPAPTRPLATRCTRMPMASARPKADGRDLAVVRGEIHAAALFTLTGDHGRV